MQIYKALNTEVLHDKEFRMGSIILQLDNKMILVCNKFNHKRKYNLELIVWLPTEKKWFRTYAKNEFNKDDQARLANYLIKECKANFMIVIKNTEYISSLYQAENKTANGSKLYVTSFDKKYFVSFQDRNNKNAQHLLITNYMVGE